MCRCAVPQSVLLATGVTVALLQCAPTGTVNRRRDPRSRADCNAVLPRAHLPTTAEVPARLSSHRPNFACDVLAPAVDVVGSAAAIDRSGASTEVCKNLFDVKPQVVSRTQRFISIAPGPALHGPRYLSSAVSWQIAHGPQQMYTQQSWTPEPCNET